jgi:hypothetical protein
MICPKCQFEEGHSFECSYMKNILTKEGIDRMCETIKDYKPKLWCICGIEIEYSDAFPFQTYCSLRCEQKAEKFFEILMKDK